MKERVSGRMRLELKKAEVGQKLFWAASSNCPSMGDINQTQVTHSTTYLKDK